MLLTVNEGHEETMRMSELASKVLLSNSGMTRRVARLVERGLLKRKQSTEDGRVFEVTLTKKGRDALETTWEFYQNRLQEVFIRFVSDKESEQLGKIFQRILDQIGGDEYRGLLKMGATDAPRRRL
ncbi:MAG: MarR family transcriptional regulator [Akkermansiaceae bacterium]|nr:MarR family transcriptional regulator [Akkermansiaceae bacterium]